MKSKLWSWGITGAALVAFAACTGSIGSGNGDDGNGTGPGSSGTGSSGSSTGPGSSGPGASTTGPGSSSTGTSTGAGGGPGTSTTTTGGGPGGGGVVNGKWQPPDCNTMDNAMAFGRLWQITDSQYVNAVRDVLGITLTGTDAQISSTTNSTGEFTNLSESGGLINDNVALNYQTAAQKVSAQAMMTAKVTSLLGSATPSAQQVQSFITNSVARLWRRPLTTAEVTSLTTLFNNANNAMDGGVPTAFGALIEAILQSPSFIFRTELGGGTAPAAASFKLTQYELAASISFLFTDSVPDATLWGKAQAGMLSDATVLAGEADRLLALPAVQANLAKHLSYWLWVERVPAREKDTTVFPAYTATLQQALYQSGEMFVQDIFANGKLSDLFTSSKVYVNKEMSTAYGIPGGTSTSLVAVTSTLPERSAGILTQPAVLAATNKRPGLVDPVHHGLFVLENLLCGGDVGDIPGPPADALAKAAMMHGNERELAAQRAMTAPCNSCHTNFDPYGLTRYTYDSIGRFSATKYVSLDNTVMPAVYSWVTSPTPLDTSGTIPDSVGPDLKGPIADASSLAKQLNSDGVSRRVAYCAGRQLSRFALGFDPNLQNSCDLKNVKENLSKTGSFKQFYKDLVTSPAYGTRDPGM